MFKRNAEIWYALIVIAVITAAYGASFAFNGALPAASTFVGHTIGVVGFVLMLMTETLYSMRKQRTDASWGSMASWLRFHIVTGLVGPYMVLLHTAMRFNGLAGVAMLLTVIVVISGIVGRYIYTNIPRTQNAAAERGALSMWHVFHVPLTWVLFAAAFVHAGAALYYATLQR